MNITLWGTRGSLASPGADTVRYGGNTSCVEVRGDRGTVIVLDAGTGIRPLGASLGPDTKRIDVLLSHLHMDHIQGLGFFEPLFREGVEVHVWGPASSTQRLHDRLARYLSPPLFPVRIREMPSTLIVHDLTFESFRVGEFIVSSNLVCHPGPTVGYRIDDGARTLAYLPDHEPALGCRDFPAAPQWTSGHALAADADVLIHDAQYGEDEYAAHVGWGHSSFGQAFAFASAARVRRLVTFHHDPNHTDATLDRLLRDTERGTRCEFESLPGTEGATIRL
jgi:phosphoribosyl 1,2-cyclic phosphodiesterase